MKHTISIFTPKALQNCFVLLFFAFTISMYGQTPPPPPVGDGLQDFCTQATWQAAGFTAMPGDNLGDLDINGENLQWYSDAALTNPIPESTIMVDGTTYYVTQTVNGVESAPLMVTVMSKSCGCIKEPDFETQDDTPTAAGYKFYHQSGDLFHKICASSVAGVAPIPLASYPDNMAELVTTGNIPFLQADGITQSTTNPSNPYSTAGIRLNKQYSTDVSDVITMSKEFIAGEVFVFNYTLMYDDPDHPFDQQPYFNVRLYDKNGNLVKSRCVVSRENDCVFVPAAGNDIYTTWSCFKINTQELQGEKARIEFTVSDCGASVHEAIIYIDDIYVGTNAGSNCNSFNFGYLAINSFTPGGSSNDCYIIDPANAGLCGAQADAYLPFPVQICGIIQAPASSGQAPNLDSLTLNIVKNGNVVGVLTNPIITGTNFCFTLYATDINASPFGQFELTADVEYKLNCGFAYSIFLNDQADFTACPPAGCPLPLVVCEDSGDGFGTFDLTSVESVIRGQYTPADVDISFYETPSDAYTQTNKITSPQTYTNTVPGGQTVYARLDWHLQNNPETAGCMYLVKVELQVSITPDVQFDEEEITACGDFRIPLVATPLNISDLGVVYYSWYKDSVQIPTLGSVYYATEPGTYVVNVSNDIYCVATDTITINQVDFSIDLGQDIVGCGVSETTLSPTVTDEGSVPPMDMSQLQYNWSTGATTESITVPESGTYWVDVTYEGCTETDTVFVSIAERPEIALREDFKICEGDEEEIVANISNISGQIHYTWYRDGGVINGATGNSITVSDAGTYRVEAYEAGAPDCIGEAKVEVSIYDNSGCVITQGISPNGDDLNESLDLTFLNDRTGISSVKIFNRYGLLIFENTGGYTNQWHGQSDDGEELVTGTYFYVIKLDKIDPVFDKQVLTGWIYVNRQVN